MFKKLFIVLLAAIVIILVVASRKPATFQVQRSVQISAAPEKVFAQINDLHSWSAWSPWEKMDPNMKRSFSGSESGLGAVYAWEGNKKVGMGRMEIVESVAQSRIVIKLDFLKPFEGHNITSFNLAPKDGGTELTWTMTGPNNLMSKVMQVFFNMDKMIGKDFEAGLAGIKATAEK